MVQVGQVIVDIVTNMKNFTASLRSANQAARASAKQIQTSYQNAFGNISGAAEQSAGLIAKHFQEASRIVSGILISQAFYNTMNEIENATESVFEFQMTLEDASTKWQMLLGSATEAEKWMRAMHEFAAQTPFDFEGVDDASAKIMMMGVEANQVLPILETVGNALAINGGGTDELKKLSKALSQMYRSPKVQAEEMEQFIENQIDAVKYLKEQLGLSAEEIKNIGDTGISGKTAAIAILQGMATDPRYADGMKKLANNTKGMINTIKESLKYLASFVTQPIFEALSSKIKAIRDRLEELQHVFDKQGAGGLFEALIPKHQQETVRKIILSIQKSFEYLGKIWKALKPAFAELWDLILKSMALLLPIIMNVLRAFAALLTYLQPLMPLLGKLLFLITVLGVVAGVSVALYSLGGAIRTLYSAFIAAQGIIALTKALQGLLLLLTRSWVGVLLLVATVAVGVALQFKTVHDWVQKAMARIAQFMGMDTSKILQPIAKNSDYSDYIKDMNKDLQDVIGDTGDTIDDTGDKAKKSKKDIDKFIAAFDEVYQIPEPKKDKDEDGGFKLKPPASGDVDKILEVLDKEIPEEKEVAVVPKIDWKSGFDWKDLFMFSPVKWIIDWGWGEGGPPGAAATAWTAAMNTIRESLKGLTASIPVINIPINVVEGVPKTAEKVGTILKNITEPLLNPLPLAEKAWKGFWEDLPQPVKDGFSDVSKSIAFSGAIVVGAVKALASDKLKEWEKGWDDFKESTEEGLKDIKKAWEDNKSPILLAVGAVTAAILLAFTGLPGAIVAALATLAVLIIPPLKKVIPNADTALKDLPKTIASKFKMDGIAKSAMDAAAIGLLGFPAMVATSLIKLPGILSGKMTLKDVVSDGITGAIKLFNKFPDEVKVALVGLPAAILAIFRKIKVPSWDIGLKGFSAKMKTLGEIVGFENGGIIGSDSIVRVGEKGRREAIIPLQNQTAMAPFADAVAQRMMQSGGLGGTQTLYVGTLIADDRSLRELERRMQVVRLNEAGRGGGPR